MASHAANGAVAPVKAEAITDPSNAPRIRVLIIWALLAVTLILINFKLVSTMRFADPDDALRLVQVRDLIAGQSWFDVHQYRVAAPAGVAMHWSRLVDVPIAAMILLLRPLLGTAWAELVTVVAIPMLTLLCAQALVARIAARFFNDDVTGLSCLTFGLAVPVLWQFTPLRIDHHAWQIVLALVALNGLYAKSALRGGAVIGLALTTSLAISIEGLPLTALFLGVCALRGLRDPATRFDWLLAATGSLALGGVAIFLGTRWTYDLVTHCDAISPVHLALFIWSALGGAALHFAAPRSLIGKLVCLAAIGGGAAVILFGVAPECRRGAFDMLDPLVRRYWYASIAEGLPFWRAGPALAATIFLGPLVGLYGAYQLWRAAPNVAARTAWLDHMLVLAGAWVIGIAVARASATALVFAAVPAAALIMRCVYALRVAPIARRLVGYAGLVVLLAPALPVVIATAALTPLPVTAKGKAKVGALSQSQCQYDKASRALNQLPATDIFAPLDIGPDLLERTHHRVVATGHHRGAAGMHDVIAAFLASPDAARSIVRTRRATLIVICPDIYEPSIYATRAPNGLMAQLLDGKAPKWLQPVDLAPGSHMRFWKVVN